MEQLEQAGRLRHHRKGRSAVYYYQATRDQWQARLASLRSFLQRVFDDDRLLFKACLEALDLNAQEFRQLRQMLRQQKKRLAGTL